MSDQDELLRELLRELLAPPETDAEGAIYRRTLDDGSEIIVFPMTFGKGRVCLSVEPPFIEDGWCYASRAEAVAAAVRWDGTGDPPDGWHRHPRTGRRREGGDPKKETVRW